MPEVYIPKKWIKISNCKWSNFIKAPLSSFLMLIKKLTLVEIFVEFRKLNFLVSMEMVSCYKKAYVYTQENFKTQTKKE